MDQTGLLKTAPWPRLGRLMLLIILAMPGLACLLLGSASQAGFHSITRLPTLTPTSLPTLTPTPAAVAMVAEPAGTIPQPLSASTPVPATDSDVRRAADSPDNLLPTAAPPSEVNGSPPVNTPTSTTTATATPVATSLPANPTQPAPPTAPAGAPAGWSFAGTRISQEPRPDLEAMYGQGLTLLYGELVNNTGAPQESPFILGTFYDAQGQIIPATAIDTVPVYHIPQAAQVPFELVILGGHVVDSFDLEIMAQPASEDILPQEFEFLHVTQTGEASPTCLTGRLRPASGLLPANLTIGAVLYDAQDRVINFGDKQYSPAGELQDFDICVDPLRQTVARYELRAWSQ